MATVFTEKQEKAAQVLGKLKFLGELIDGAKMKRQTRQTLKEYLVKLRQALNLPAMAPAYLQDFPEYRYNPDNPFYTIKNIFLEEACLTKDDYRALEMALDHIRAFLVE